MGQLIVQRRDPAWVHRDPTGGWRHNYLRGGVLVSPQPRKASWRVSRELTLDVFCHTYRPQSGDIVVELGAGCGTETVNLSAMVGPTGRVIAVEAHPWTASLLTATVAANRLENVTVVQAAISDRPGTVRITDDANAANIRNRITTTGGIEVPALTLDALMEQEEAGSIDFLKVNIEGAENQLLDSMDTTVGDTKHVAMSCHDFGADLLGDESLRSKDRARKYFAGRGFAVTERPQDTRYWVRDYLYCDR